MTGSTTAARAVVERRAPRRPKAEGDERPIPALVKYLENAARWLDLDIFPTPPWATRALLRHALPHLVDVDKIATAHDPCCGLGHMATVLRETIPSVVASDVFDYGLGFETLDYLQFDPAVLDFANRPQWIFANPPFLWAEKFLLKALATATWGVAFLVRLPWQETTGRYHNLWLPTPPTVVAPFVERVPMCLGGWDPKLRGQTVYAWYIWVRGDDGQWRFSRPGEFLTRLIPPGCREGLTLPSDQKLAALHVPGWIAPSTRKNSGDAQLMIEDAA